MDSRQLYSINRRLAGYIELLDFVGLASRGGGVDGYLEEFSAGVQLAYQVLFIGFRCPVGYLEGTGRIGAEEGAEDFPGLLLGAAAGGRDYRNVHILREPAGEGIDISLRQITGYGGKNGKLPVRVLRLCCGSHQETRQHQQYA